MNDLDRAAGQLGSVYIRLGEILAELKRLNNQQTAPFQVPAFGNRKLVRCPGCQIIYGIDELSQPIPGNT